MRTQMLERVRQRMDEEDIEVLAVTRDMNIEYFIDVHPTGDDGLSGILLITADSWQFLVSKFFRYSFSEMSNVDVYTRQDELEELLEQSVLEDGCCTDNPSRFSSFDLDETEIVERCRKYKTKREIDRMEKACRKGSEVFENVLQA